MKRKGFAYLSVLAILALAVILPVTIFLVGQNQNRNSKAAEPVVPAQGVSVVPAGFLVDSVYVDADLPNKNLSSSAILWADGSSVKVSYLKFDLTSLGQKKINSAKLIIFVDYASSGTQNVRGVEDVTWSGDSLVFQNRPTVGPSLGAISGTKAGSTAEVDLTAYVQSHVGRFISVEVDSTNPSGLGFASKAALTRAPALVIE